MKLRVALIGAGNIARAFLNYWVERNWGIDLRVVSVVRRGGTWHGDSPASLDLDKLEYQSRMDPFHDAQLVIEALPSVYPHGEPATSWLTLALNRRIDVITVDKGPLVAAYRDLAQTATHSGARLRFCVGGALPAVDVATRDLRGATIQRIRAILNGTTNFVLSEMEARSCSIEDALALAIERGIAEPDPTQDVEGIDTAAKMVILVNAGLDKNIRLEDVSIHGIQHVDLNEARRKNAVWKLIGTYENSSIRVNPYLVPKEDLFSRINGTHKIVQFDTAEMGTVYVAGGASGRKEMGATITKELLNLYT